LAVARIYTPCRSPMDANWIYGWMSRGFNCLNAMAGMAGMAGMIGMIGNLFKMLVAPNVLSLVLILFCVARKGINHYLWPMLIALIGMAKMCLGNCSVMKQTI